MEHLTREAITTGFPDDPNSGQPVWKAEDVDEKENGPLIKDYKPYTRPVVIVDIKEGGKMRWKNSEDVRDHVDCKDALIDCIQTETRSCLGTFEE